MKKFSHPLFYVLIGLAAFGLLWQLIFSTQRLLTNLLYFGLAILIVLGIYHFFIRKRQRPSSKYNRGYHSAYSNKEATTRSFFPPLTFSKTGAKSKKKSESLKKKNRKHNFTVIEGNKGKRKI